MSEFNQQQFDEWLADHACDEIQQVSVTLSDDKNAQHLIYCQLEQYLDVPHNGLFSNHMAALEVLKKYYIENYCD